ncbi:site-specific DNA-methyltransferase [Pseudomonas sp. LM20]|uniref:site-specific DNA-methyltransferase n=1 Tax=Pseudomonas sp. LM20 TaxID=2899116 RepID=UPI001F3F08CA|nr:site-specific DNA-methyltransferase [Pseudomonas sp. LM20]MCE5985453.1 site-specific DNA-methyltransferase [Pseudomonas sp. LM20]
MSSSLDEKIVNQVALLGELDKEYWSFSRRAKRTHCHGFIKYPAMMVPEMQGELIDIFLKHKPEIKSIFDPFVGSGTTLGEAIVRGLDFQGVDINPLAILACETKSDVFYISSLEEKIFGLIARLDCDKMTTVEVSFPKINKWFLPRIQVELSKIRRAIMAEPSKWARRFFWVAFSDTVRGSCNSRSSTYKLHMKHEQDLCLVGCCFDLFKSKLNSNFLLKKEQVRLLEAKDLLSRASLKSLVDLSIGDIQSAPRQSDCSRHDMLITSPPYGDNSTTVPYGQFSYLPLMWIDTADLRNKVPAALLTNASAIDRASLGGVHKCAIKDVERLRDMSTSFSHSIENLSKYANNGPERLAAFINDLDNSLDGMLYRIKKDGYLVWTLGNRHISAQKIPLNSILRELLEARGCQFVLEIDRIIPYKRMANRNSSSKTMTEEQVLIMRKI